MGHVPEKSKRRCWLRPTRPPAPVIPTTPSTNAPRHFQRTPGSCGAGGVQFSAEFEAYRQPPGELPDRMASEAPDVSPIAAGGGAMPADTATFLGVGGDLTPGVISPGEARAMGRPDLAGYTKEVGADGQVVAVPPEGGYDPQAAAAAEAAQSWAADASALLEVAGY